MAKFKWFNGNQGVYRYTNFERFDITGMNNNSITGEYNGQDGAINELIQPFSFKMKLKNAERLDPNDSDSLYTDGTIKSITWYNSNGDKLLTVSGLNVSLPVVSAMIAANELWNIWDFLTAGGHVFNGSDDSMNLVDDWDGDDIKTGFGDDTVNGNGGSDFITDAGGSDVYRGGDGTDTINYSQTFWRPWLGTDGINADLAAGEITGPDGNVDRVVSIENIRGTAAADIMRGDAGNNRFAGLQGKDFFDGRGGFDMLRYDRDDRQGGTSGVTVDLKKGKATDGFGNVDKFENIEGVRGSNYDDVLKDNNKGNYLDGRDGDDILCASKGDDTLRGGSGDDQFIFKTNNFGENVIQDFEVGADTIEIRNADRFNQLTIADNGDGDAVVSFANGSVTLEGVAAADLSASDFIF